MGGGALSARYCSLNNCDSCAKEEIWPSGRLIDGKFHEGLLESCKKMVRELWRCVCKILLRVVLILKVHDRYDHREVRPAEGKVKDVKFRA